MVSPYISDAEFNRFTEYMGGQFLGGPALVRHLFDDLGKVDGQGRPEQGCSIWWFIASLEPTATKTSFVREDLIGALKRGHLGRDEVVKTAWKMIGDARALVNDGTQAARVGEFGFSGAKASYADKRATLLKMLHAAEITVRQWADDPSYRGNSYFYARPGSGQEFVSSNFVAEGPNARKYATSDDQYLQSGPTLAQRIETLGDPKAEKPKLAASSKPSSKPVPAPPSMPSRFKGFAQSDAVRAMIATDVIDFAAGEGLDAQMLSELGGHVVDDVATFFHGDQAAVRKKFLGPAVSTATKGYAGLDAAEAKKSAEAVLAGLGVAATDVRSFRNQLAKGLTASDVATPPASGAKNVAYAAVAEQMQALADGVKAAGSVSGDVVAKLDAMVDSLDLATIYDQTPSLQDHFQTTFCYYDGLDGPYTEALTDIYWRALNGHAELAKASAAKTGHVPFDTAREKMVEIMSAASASNAPGPEVLDALKAVVASVEPKAWDKSKRSDFASMICVVAFHASAQLQSDLRAYAKDLTSPA